MKFKVKKRFIKLFFCFIFLFIGIFLCIKFFSKGYTKKYSVDNGKYNIKEVYTEDTKNEIDNYYIEISVNNVVFNFQLYKEKSDKGKIVKDVIYYDGDYKCILPILEDDIKVDFLCYKENTYYNYSAIKGIDEDLDKYINNISKDKYNNINFQDKLDNEKVVKKINYYNSDIFNDYTISFTNLNGVVSADNSIKFTEIFGNDIYSRPISIFVNNYYVTANYDKKQQFREFYIIDLIKDKKKIVKAPNYISFDSYIQGIVEDEIYIYDIDNERQYKININDSQVIEVGNSKNNILYYNNGKWEKISTVRAKKIELFTYNNKNEFEEYDYVIKEGNKLSGFYYLIKENKDIYDVYKVNVQNTKIKKYIFSVDNVDDIVYTNDILLFRDEDRLKIYTEEYGIKTIIKYSELKYNDNIKFYILKK